MMVGAITVTVIIAGVLVYWFVLRWEATPKRWCAMFYLTSITPETSAPVNRPDTETGLTAHATLDQKLDQVRNVIRALPCATTAGINADPAWDDVYVVYRAIWDDVTRDPEACVVRPEWSAPCKTYFPGETIFDVGLSVDLTKDLTAFFVWAYENCPADHYAVFFWGHAMGPAGLFHASQKPLVIPPLLALLMRGLLRLTGSNSWSGSIGTAAVSAAIGAVVQRRLQEGRGRDQGKQGRMAPPGGEPPAGPIVLEIGQPVPKVDVVLFQDCWMSTLETAFELQDDARYIVASQSLVPVGFDAAGMPGAVWPYKDLISTFLNQPNFAAPMMTVLKDFFDGCGLPPSLPPDYNRYPATKVLFALMDCGDTAGAVTSTMKAEWQALVRSLYILDKPGRSLLIDQAEARSGRLFELLDATLQVGDQALVDILTLCAYLKTPAQWPSALVVAPQDQNAITSAALALEAKVLTLVTSTFQSPPPLPGAKPYSGVAALYKPFVILGDDPYIMAAFRSSYERFRFSKETRVMPPPPGGVRECSWTQVRVRSTQLVLADEETPCLEIRRKPFLDFRRSFSTPL